MSSTGSRVTEGQRHTAEGFVLQAPRPGSPQGSTQHPGDCAEFKKRSTAALQAILAEAS